MMDVRDKTYKKLSILSLWMLFSNDVFAHAPTPECYYAIQLVETPPSLTVTLHEIPEQLAQANSAFYLNLKQYIGLSQPELSYRITNVSRKKSGTRHIIGISSGISGIPSSVIQMSNRPGDCPTPFVLARKHNENCLLHFRVNSEHYEASQDGSGPWVSMQTHWRWGSHDHHGAQTNLYAPNENDRIATLLAPIMTPTTLFVTPVEQDGLRYDLASASIVGKPTRLGDYAFTINATNGSSITTPQTIHILSVVNPADTPVFKRYPHTLISATPQHEYGLDLMSLIEQKNSFMQNNQIRFRIDPHKDDPPWISIDNDGGTFLHGYVPDSDVGQIRAVTIIATSNTGGDSLEPLTLKIPVAVDVERRPVIDPHIKLTAAVGEEFEHNFSESITDLTADPRLRFIIDNIEPAAPWLAVSPDDPTKILGKVPPGVDGQTYQLTLYANTPVGGNSKPVTIPLQIAIDTSKTPHFNVSNPRSPPFYRGQPYCYDFAEHPAIEPTWGDFPYVVTIVRGSDSPEWLRMEGNTLIADKVPDDVPEGQHLFVTITNIPGGRSQAITLTIAFMT